MASNELDLINTELKKELSSLIISSAKGLTVKRLRFDYREFFGSDVPFKKLGYNNFEQYLLSIPNTCRLIGSGDHASVVPVVTEKNKHINDMILKQRPPKSNSRYRPPRRSRGVYNVKSEPEPRPKPFVPFKLPVLNPDSHKVLLPPPHDYFLNMRKEQNKSTPKINFNFKPEVNHVSNSCGNTLNSSKPQNEMYKIEEPSTSGLQINKIREEHSYKSSENSKPFTTADSDEDSDADFYQELGFFEEENFCYQSEDDEDLSSCINNLEVKDDQPCPMLDLPIVEEPHVSRVNSKVKEKLRELIADYPDGIWCSKLLRLYEQKFNQQLDPLNFGFPSVIQMCDDLPDVFYCIRPNRMDWKLYDKTKPIPDIHTMRDFSKYLQTLPFAQDNRRNTEPALPTDIMYTSPTYKYPDEILHPGELIKRQWLINFEKPGEYIELVVSEVYDPSKFWIQFKGPTTSDALAKVMDEMQVYYMHQAGTLQLNEFSVRIGLMCAALFMNEFHRAIVIKVFDDQTIKVFYVDYGTVAQVQLRRTCFLHRDFADLPMQAVRARLANIIPKEQNTMWSRAASNYMLQLIMEKDLIAYITSIDYEQEILNLVVTDTTMPDVDIHINDMLVEQGFAILGNEALICETSSALIPNVHLYPSFEELENFVYPNVSDVITMLKLGHTYETIFDGYFASSANRSTPHNFIDLNHSRSSTSMEQTSSQSFSVEHETIHEKDAGDFDPEETDQDLGQQAIYEENCEQEESHIEAEECNIESDDTDATENVHFDSTEEVISLSDIDEAEISLKEEIPHETQCPPNMNYSKPPPGFGNCPPGFENVQPQNFNGGPFVNMFKGEALLPDPVYNLNPLTGYPLLQTPLTPLPNYPLINANLNPSYNLLLSNPLLYNQLNQMVLNQQREALMHTVQQVKMMEELQRLKALNQQQHYARMNQATNRVPPNYNVPNTSQNTHYSEQTRFSQQESTSQNSESDKIFQPFETQNTEMSNISNELPSCRMNPHQKNIHENAANNNFHIASDVNENNKGSISNISEHICDRFVVKLKLKNCTIHVLRIDGELYVVSQEIISNLLNYDIPLKTWMKSVNLTVHSFPNRLVNIMNYENVYNQIKSYSIPGINPPNNLGCNVRLTSLNDVADIVKRFGNVNILSDLKAGIAHVTKKPDLWKVLDSSD